MTAGMTRAHTCPQHAPPIGSRAPATLSARVAVIVRRGWRTYWDRRARRATVLILCSLDERTLRDIGIAPGEIESCVYARGADRLRRYHARWPWRAGG